MKVLVTGGAGYIGTELVAQLIANPEVEKVIIYDNLSRLNYNLFLGLRLQKHFKLSDSCVNRLTQSNHQQRQVLQPAQHNKHQHKSHDPVRRDANILDCVRQCQGRLR